jgi:hypothetical protein
VVGRALGFLWAPKNYAIVRMRRSDEAEAHTGQLQADIVTAPG